MPWKECSVVDERMRFIAKVIEGHSMTDVCRQFGISRKTGHKIWSRYKDSGSEALNDRSRRPVHYAHQLPFQVEQAILSLKNEFKTWGAPKIREKLKKRFPAFKLPAKSTIHAVLDRHGLVTPRRGRYRFKSQGTELIEGQKPNDLWCTDYKGQFLLGNKKYCYPLTITDHKSRYLITCEALENTQEQYALTAFERTFKEFGMPDAIRSDNGAPFASVGLFGLSKLSVWWLRLGIKIQRTKPGNPQQNGRHERMHLTLKKEATKPSGKNILQQQAKFDDFIDQYNNDRPHEALNMKCPGEIYVKSKKIYKGLPQLEYPGHDRIMTVTHCGRICMDGLKINFCKSFAGQLVGIREVEEGVWLVSFMNYDIGYFDVEIKKVEPIENPFGPGLLPMSPV
jgi:transposase InsO family protein